MPAAEATTRCPGPLTVVVSRYNPSITDALLEGARREHARQRGAPQDLRIVHAPGSFELPVLARAAATRTGCAGVVALGCVIRGETTHDQHIAHAVAGGLMEVSLQTGVPVAFGVLTVTSAEQARARAGGDKGNKGAEAMAALLDTIRSMRSIDARAESPQIGEKPDKAVVADGAATHG